MKESQIREWMEFYEKSSGSQECYLHEDEIYGLMKELLQFRILQATVHWRAWIPADTPQGWQCAGMFTDREMAQEFRARIRKPDRQVLILPFLEQPAITAR